MSILSWIIFGLIVGLLAHLIDSRDVQGGILSSIILGIVGAVVGGFLGDALFGVGVTGFNLSSFIVAVTGAIIVVIVQRSFTRRML